MPGAECGAECQVLSAARATTVFRSARLRRAGLLDLSDKLAATERLTLADGVRLFETPDLLALGWLANRERERRHAGKTYYNYNIRIEATNVCVATCLFCSFSRLRPGDPALTRCRRRRPGTSCGSAPTSR